MCHVQTFHHCPPAYVLQEICHDQSAMGGMTLDSASSTRMEERGIEDMEREPDVKDKQGGMDNK